MKRAARRPLEGLLAQSEAGDDRPVALDVVLLDVIEQAATAAYQHQEASTAVMVLLVGLQMLSEMLDAFGQQRDLHLGRPCIGVVRAVGGDGGRFVGHAAAFGSD